MTGFAAYLILGLLIPVFGGTGLARLLFPAVSGARPAEWLGVGLLAGPAVASLAMHLLHWNAGAGAWLGAIGLLALGFLGHILRPSEKLHPADPLPSRGSFLKAAATVAAVLVAIQTYFVAQEVLLRPTFPWDAWSAWVYKAKAWYLAGQMPDFLDPGAWPPGESALAYPVMAPNYPTLIAGFQVYLAQWLGQWHEPLLNLPWLLAQAALGLLVFGEVFRLSGRRAFGVLAACLVTSVPLVATHVALAGYMDIWVAAVLLAFVVSLIRLAGMTARYAAMPMIFAVALISVKVEAVIWLLAAMTAALPHLPMATPHAPTWLRSPAVAPLAGAIVLGLAAGAAWIGGSVALPYFGIVGFEFNPQSPAILSSLFASWNWHLFFPAFAVCLALDGSKRSDDPVLTSWRTPALIGLSAVLALCLFLKVAGKTVDITNYNRIFIHWMPVWAVYAAAVLTQAVKVRD